MKTMLTLQSRSKVVKVFAFLFVYFLVYLMNAQSQNAESPKMATSDALVQKVKYDSMKFAPEFFVSYYRLGDKSSDGNYGFTSYRVKLNKQGGRNSFRVHVDSFAQRIDIIPGAAIGNVTCIDFYNEISEVVYTANKINDINVSQLPKGLYYIRVCTDTGRTPVCAWTKQTQPEAVKDNPVIVNKN